MKARLRRLKADFAKVTTELDGHPHITLSETSGEPPDHYILEYKVPSLVALEEGREPSSQAEHRVEVFLPMDYPRRPPFARMLNPVFHPNIDPQKICIGDHWSAGQSLSNLLLQIAEMLCFQSYNVKSPLNPEAAVWAEENLERLPLLETDLRRSN